MGLKLNFFIILLLLSYLAQAAESLKPIKNWVVFPFDAVDEKLKPSANKAWWDIRQKITETKKYSIASKQFLIQKDVYQPRKNLRPDDVKYLSKLLEADIIITGWSEYRDFQLNVYLSQNGELLWSKKLGFHPSLNPSEQLFNISQRLIQEFLDKLPFHGVLVKSDDTTVNAVSIDIGKNENLSMSDEVQFVNIELPDKWDTSIGLNNLQITAMALGKVVKPKKAYSVVEIKKDLNLPEEGIFVFVAKEQKRKQYEQTLAPELQPTLEEDVGPGGEHPKNVIVFGSIFSFLAILLLAF
ncbi:MAG: hypothetical protein IPM57_08395 [Oligoflexia bacterium]|nr:hypothetical protein [Oligoflexia bacterium]